MVYIGIKNSLKVENSKNYIYLNRKGEYDMDKREKKVSISVQDIYLNEARKSGSVISMYLLNGVNLKGKVKSYDKFCVVLKGDKEYLIYKHAISTIIPLENGVEFIRTK